MRCVILPTSRSEQRRETTVPDGVEASEQMVSEWTRRLQERAERYQQMADRVQEISVTERSKDGTVQVTVSSKGLLTNLTIAESAQARRMSELAAQIMTTVQRAQARIPELLRQAMTETVGTEDETANRVFESARQHFPEPPEEEPPSRQQGPAQMRFGPAEEEPPQAPPSPPAPDRPQPPVTRPPRSRPADDEDDWGGPSILR
jgi:DNA-binding protein YbaB